MKLQALLLDCDGVLAETERDGHRVAFNRAFAEHGLDIEWSAELYRELLQVAGGKERMRAWFERAGWPAAATDRDAFIRLLHATKTRHFLSIVAAGGLRARPGVRRIIDEALASGVRVAICSTSDERSVRAVTRSVLGVDLDEMLLTEVKRNSATRAGVQLAGPTSMLSVSRARRPRSPSRSSPAASR